MTSSSGIVYTYSSEVPVSTRSLVTRWFLTSVYVSVPVNFPEYFVKLGLS